MGKSNRKGDGDRKRAEGGARMRGLVADPGRITSALQRPGVA